MKQPFLAMPNIQFNYLYRDAGNYKSYHSIVFENSENLSLELVQEKIVQHLIQGEYFIPQEWNVPLLEHHPYDQELDHEWYEFERVAYTEEKMTEDRDIKEFLRLLQ